MRPDLPARLFTPAARERLPGVDWQPVALEQIGAAEVLLTCWGCPPVTAEVLATAPHLRAIVHAGGGVKGHVTDACWERGILVSTAADANAVPVAEYTLAMILIANKGVQRAARAYAERRGPMDLVTELPGVGNYRKTVGIVGASRIGRRVIELLAPFDLDVLVHDPYLPDSVALDELIARSDVVSIHAPALPSTRHLIDARRLALMKPSAVLVNTARGTVVDEAALADGLHDGRLFAAGLDVFEREPSIEPRLLSAPRTVLLPHIGSASQATRTRMATMATEAVATVLAGGRPTNVV